jgi:transposase
MIGRAAAEPLPEPIVARLRVPSEQISQAAQSFLRACADYFWAIARDDRPWGATDPPAIAYSYAPGRGAIHALKLLQGYRGMVQCDGYAAYKTVADAEPGEAITLAFCWTHLRRRFFDIAKGGNAPIAGEALERIAALYAIEKTIRGYSAEARRAVRQECSHPLVIAFRTWLEHQLVQVSAKAPVAEAIRYGLHHWDGLTRFVDDGRIELDTNIVERGIRPIVLNRKNALFAGHDQGAENWACIASLIETCKLNGVARLPPVNKPLGRTFCRFCADLAIACGKT